MALLLATGCVPHLAAPARTADGYRAAVGKTVGAATSAVATAELLARTATVQGAFFPYLAIAATDAEDDLGSTVETFSSIQPPDDASTQLRAEVVAALGQAQDDVAAVRIQLRAGRTDGLPDLIAALQADGEALDALEPA